MLTLKFLNDLGHNSQCIIFRHVLNVFCKVYMRVVVGRVGDGAHDDIRDIVFVTDLSDRASFHFDAQYFRQIFPYFIQLRDGTDELITAADLSAVNFRLVKRERFDVGFIDIFMKIVF